MSSTDTSSSSRADVRDLSAAIAALTAYLDDRQDYGDSVEIEDTDWTSPDFTLGHLRAIAAALDGIHIPGHVEKDWAEITDTPAEHWTVARYQAGRMFATERHYFVPAVTS